MFRRLSPQQRKWVYRLAVVAALGATALACFAPLVRHPTDLLVGAHRRGANDLTAYFLGATSFPAGDDAHGGSAHWNPYRFGGVPHTGNPQAALWYPPGWLARLWSHPARLSWLFVAHHLLAGWGTYLVCRGQGWRRTASGIGGIIFLAAPNLLAHSAEGHYTLVCAAAWIPWVFWAYTRWRREEPFALSLLCVMLSLCFLAGHAQTTYYLTVVLTAFMLGDAARLALTGKLPRAQRLASQWVLLGLLTALLISVDLLPLWFYTRGTLRTGGMGAAEAGSLSIGLANLWQVVAPHSLGNADTYRGPGKFYWETLCYFGICPLVLALVGLVTKRRSPLVRKLALLGAIALWFAAGSNAGLFDVLYRLLPGVSMFRVPARALLFCSFSVSVLAAAGVQRLQVLARFVRSGSLRLALSPVAAVVGAICLGELAYFGQSLFATVPVNSLRNESSLAVSLQQQPELGRVFARQLLLSDREAEAAGIHKLASYDPLFPAATTAVALETSNLPNETTAQQIIFGLGGVKFDTITPKLLDLFQVRYAALPEKATPPAAPWRAIARGTVPAEHAVRGKSAPQLAYVLYENPAAIPRAFVQGNVEVATSTKAALAAVAEIDMRQSLVLAQDVLPAGPRQTFRPARVVEYTPDRLELEAELDEPGYLYVADAWWAGWSAESAGRQLPVLPANVAFRAVPLEAGKHRVTMRFDPPGRAAGVWLSLLGVACLVFYCVHENSLARRKEEVAGEMDMPTDKDRSSLEDAEVLQPAAQV